MYVDNKVAPVDQYLRKVSGQDKESSETIYDHNYVKHWSIHAGSERTKPAIMLFMPTSQRQERANVGSDDEIDVVDVSENTTAPSPFDNQKTRILANELEHSLKSNLNNLADRTELDDFPIENYIPQKRKIYREVMEIINEDILAKAVYSGQANEFIQRKTVTEACARQLRHIFANTFYDFDLILWIHQLILDKGNLSTVASYLSILQALRTKIPGDIIDRIIKTYSGQLGYGYLNQILKKNWDPSVPVLNQHKLKKLPRNPLLIMSCAGFNLNKAISESPRFHFWTSNLNTLCKTIHIPMKYKEDGSETFGDAIDDTMSALKSKITEFRNHYPNRPVILAGWTVGAVIACLVALETEVDAVICFGFSLTGVNGSRGGLDDPLLDSKVPTLFIVGQKANMCSIDDMEDFRSRMKAVTGLVVVGGADDILNISPQKMRLEAITQEIVDRCILDEINNFLESCLLKSQAASSSVASSNSVKACPPIREESPDIINPDEVGKRKRRRPREYSPELISSSRKKPCHAATKEVPSVSTKSHLPSSPRSGRKGRHHISKSAKRSSDRKAVERSPGGSSRKKMTTGVNATLIDMPKDRGSLVRKFKIDRPIFPVIPPEEPPAPPKEAKPVIPFALNILPKKNVPVDVDAAFGSDSSFLPRPLTPPEPEDNTVSAEETESALGELEASFASSMAASELPSTSFSSPPGPQIITVSEKSLIPSPEQSSPSLQDAKMLSSSIVKHVLTASPETTKLVSATPSGIKTVFLKDKALTSSPVSHIKSINDSSLIARTVTQVKSPSTAKTMITVPLNAGPLLVSGQTLKTPSGKIFQFLSKSPVSSQPKEAIMPKLIASPHEATQQIYSMSSVNDMTKRVSTTSSATLVKLAVSDKQPGMKHIQVIKPSPVRSDPAKVETTAEIIEKQLAIQALNEREMGLDSSNEESLAYSKPTTSIISRVVPRPGHAPYIRQSIIAHPPMRGRMRPILPNKLYHMYPK